MILIKSAERCWQQWIQFLLSLSPSKKTRHVVTDLCTKARTAAWEATYVDKGACVNWCNPGQSITGLWFRKSLKESCFPWLLGEPPVGFQQLLEEDCYQHPILVNKFFLLSPSNFRASTWANIQCTVVSIRSQCTLYLQSNHSWVLTTCLNVRSLRDMWLSDICKFILKRNRNYFVSDTDSSSPPSCYVPPLIYITLLVSHTYGCYI